MKGKLSVIIFSLALLLSIGCNGQINQSAEPATPTIFAYGGEMNLFFLKYIVSLTHQENPKICFIPTAGADNPYVINYWYELCLNLKVRPSVLRVFINSSPGQESFEEALLKMDAIVVGGGNTLNMMGIWKAQGIDTILKKAYQKGIILAGGSAGSLCWFKNGITDSRPQQLTVVDCLGFINTSHCPHFSSEPGRKPLYEKYILEGKIPSGYALDDQAAVLFQNNKFVKALSLNKYNNVYFISVKDGKINEEKFDAELIK